MAANQTNQDHDFIKILNLETINNQTSANERQRIFEFVDQFKRVTGLDAEYVVKAPGRVNLIGDHIDYHGFSVLPMAIENSLLVGLAQPTQAEQDFQLPGQVSTKLEREEGPERMRAKSALTDSQQKSLFLINANSEAFPPIQLKHSFAHGSNLDKSHQWHYYVLCAYHGVLACELLSLKPNQVLAHAKQAGAQASSRGLGDQIIGGVGIDENCLKFLKDMVLFVDSNLPPASGLSSSSALVCGSALAFHLALQEHRQEFHPIDSRLLAESCSNFEHLIGTHGGGMDQAVILTAQEGFLKYVEFTPKFKCSNVHLPKQIVCLVSHCGESFPKAATFAFNSRVLETKLAAAVLLKTLRPSSKLVLDHAITLSQVKEELLNCNSSTSCNGDARFNAVKSTSELMSLIEQRKVFCNQDGSQLGLNDVCSRLQLSLPELVERFNTSEEFLSKSGLETKLQLSNRLKHVLEEAQRVDEFKLICETSFDIKRLGELMFESHTSLRDNYECSHPALDKLVDVAREAGALGARLTGAGWGGCIVSLVEVSRSGFVLERLRRVSKFTFPSEPQAGAFLIKLA